MATGGTKWKYEGDLVVLYFQFTPTSFKNLRLKKGKISGLAQNGTFFNIFFFGFLSITPFKTIKLLMLGGVLKNSGNLQQDGHKNLQNC